MTEGALRGTRFVRLYPDVYVAAGGFRPVTTGEEHELWTRLRARGDATVSSTAAPVLTSGRRIGRAPAGFAGYLNALERTVQRASA